MTRKSTLALAAAAAVAVFPRILVAESQPVPERLLVAQYVALGIDLGDRIVAAESLTSEAWRATAREREALEQIRQRLESWERYVVVNRLADAEVLLVVRQGRRASVGGGGAVSVGTGARVNAGASYSGDDMLAVYDGGASSSTLWRMLTSNGLAGGIPLFESFRADVERAALRRKKP